MKQLEDAFNALGIEYDEGKINKYEQYMQGVLKWNKVLNLTTITENEEFIKKHYIDSVICAKFDEFKNANSIIDIGTGAGFPGVPLAIIAEGKKFTLVDSSNKKIKVVDELCSDIKIANIKVIHGRAEDLGNSKLYREKYDLCVAKAVAKLSVLVEYCLPFVAVEGYLLAYKGPELDNEIEIAQKAIDELGGQIEKIEKIVIPNFDLDHRILFIKKVKNTPAKYPRKSGTPSSKPIK